MLPYSCSESCFLYPVKTIEYNDDTFEVFIRISEITNYTPCRRPGWDWDKACQILTIVL